MCFLRRPQIDNGYPVDHLEVSDNEGPNYFNMFCKVTGHSDLQVENPDYGKKVSDDDGYDYSNTFLEATTHSNLQDYFLTENARKFKCSYDCDFLNFSIEEY